jgi:hypothetical protein
MLLCAGITLASIVEANYWRLLVTKSVHFDMQKKIKREKSETKEVRRLITQAGFDLFFFL